MLREALVCSQHLVVLASMQSTLEGVGYSSVTGNITHYPTLGGVGQVACSWGQKDFFFGGGGGGGINGVVLAAEALHRVRENV